MKPVQSGNFRELLRIRNTAMLKLREAHEAGFCDDEPEELSEQWVTVIPHDQSESNATPFPGTYSKAQKLFSTLLAFC